MKTTVTTSLLAFALLFGAGSAQAELTREQVKQQLAEAKANGEYTFGELEYPVPLPLVSTKNQTQILAEIVEAKGTGEYTFGELEYPDSYKNAVYL